MKKKKKNCMYLEWLKGGVLVVSMLRGAALWLTLFERFRESPALISEAFIFFICDFGKRRKMTKPSRIGEPDWEYTTYQKYVRENTKYWTFSQILIVYGCMYVSMYGKRMYMYVYNVCICIKRLHNQFLPWPRAVAPTIQRKRERGNSQSKEHGLCGRSRHFSIEELRASSFGCSSGGAGLCFSFYWFISVGPFHFTAWSFSDPLWGIRWIGRNMCSLEPVLPYYAVCLLAVTNGTWIRLFTAMGCILIFSLLGWIFSYWGITMNFKHGI